MKFIRGHNSKGVDRSKPYKATRYLVQDAGYETPCWIWQLKRTPPGKGGPGGYGVELNRLAHRAYYERANGPIPSGMQIDHLCRNRACVNPTHMEVVTPLENTRRGRSSKLTYEQARDIEQRSRERAGDRSLLANLALEYGVSYETVRLIYRNGADGPRRG